MDTITTEMGIQGVDNMRTTEQVLEQQTAVIGKVEQLMEQSSTIKDKLNDIEAQNVNLTRGFHNQSNQLIEIKSELESLEALDMDTEAILIGLETLNNTVLMSKLQLVNKVNNLTLSKQLHLPTDCAEIEVNEGCRYREGVKTIHINGNPIQVHCDNDGYTTIQSRGQFGNPQDYFYRDWASYLKPFGSPGKEFWLGLENIYSITNGKNYSLKIYAKDVDGNTDEATWNSFKLTDQVSFMCLNSIIT